MTDQVPSVVSPAIDDERHRAYAAMLDRYATLDLTQLLVMRIGEVNPAALPNLAWQFHIQGLEGWNLAHSEEQQRALIEGSIPLHRTKGTPGAVEGALHRLGYPSAQVVERVGEYDPTTYRHDGMLLRDGVATYHGGRLAGDRRWATFRVSIDFDDLPVAGTNLPEIRQVIHEYQRGSVWLTDISFSGDVLEDPLELTDDMEVGLGTDIVDGFPNVPRHDSTYRRGGVAFARHDGLRRRNGIWLYDRRGRPVGTEIYYGHRGWSDEFGLTVEHVLFDGFGGASRRDGSLRFDGQSCHDGIQPALQDFLDLEWGQVELSDATQ